MVVPAQHSQVMTNTLPYFLAIRRFVTGQQCSICKQKVLQT